MSNYHYSIAEQFIIVSDEYLAIMGARLLIDKHFKESNCLVTDTIKRFRELIEQNGNRLSICLFFLQLTPDNISNVAALTEYISNKYPSLFTVFFVTPQTLQYTKMLINCGARGIFLKTASEQKLVNALKEIINGELFIEREVRQNIDDIIQLMPDTNYSALNKLSAREKKVLNKLLAGVKIKQISAEMGISQSTASTYFSRLKSKLKVSNLIELKNLLDRHKSHVEQVKHYKK